MERVSIILFRSKNCLDLTTRKIQEYRTMDKNVEDYFFPYFHKIAL